MAVLEEAEAGRVNQGQSKGGRGYLGLLGLKPEGLPGRG